MRENRTQGSVRGRSGNWPFYLDGGHKKATKGGKNVYSKRDLGSNDGFVSSGLCNYQRRLGKGTAT